MKWVVISSQALYAILVKLVLNVLGVSYTQSHVHTLAHTHTHKRAHLQHCQRFAFGYVNALISYEKTKQSCGSMTVQSLEVKQEADKSIRQGC